jgi:ATP-binding cassette subfamily B protein
MPPPRLDAAAERRFSVAELRQSLAHVRATLKLVWESSAIYTSAFAALTFVGALVPLGVAWAGKRIVDGVVAGTLAGTARWVAIEFAFVVAQATTLRGLGLVRSLLSARLGLDINVAILEKALHLDLRHFEDSEFYDRLTRARREASSRPVALITDAFGLVQNTLTLAGYAALLVRYSHWVVLVLLVGAIPATVAEMRYSKLAFRIRNWRSPDSRRLLYLEYVLANDEHAKEVKLFGLGPMLMSRYRDLGETFYREDRKLAIRRAGLTHVLSLLGSGAFYGSYGLMALAAARGELSLGNMTLYVVAFRSGQQAFQSILSGIGGIYEHNLYMSNLFEYLAVPPRAGGLAARAEGAARTSLGAAESLTAGGEGRAPGEVDSLAVSAAAVPLGRGIWFDDVGFRYPDQDRWAVRHISLFVPEGESVALVGENGAGKTTLVKLITRLYEPTEGRIVLDGRDLRDWDETELYERFGVLFQDFNQYQFRVRENVGFGSVPHMGDEARIVRAIEQGGAAELVSGLASGIESPLGRWFQDGVELSGGQWQKIGLARAFMREQADILILDEPTAALDARAEHAVFERFRQLTRGRTTIVISHRFPTVRMANVILVLENGQIAEKGSHAELVAAGGIYARMFALQAEGYQ